MPATDKGKTNLKKVVILLAPSILADSITLLGRLIIKSLNKNVANGNPKPEWANHVATNVPLMSKAGIIGIPSTSIPLLNNWTRGMRDICSGIIIEATTNKNNFKNSIDGKFLEDNDDGCDIYHYYVRFFEVETLDQTLFLIGVATDYAKEYPDAPYIWKQNKNNDLEVIGTSNIEKYSLNFELSK